MLNFAYDKGKASGLQGRSRSQSTLWLAIEIRSK